MRTTYRILCGVCLCLLAAAVPGCRPVQTPEQQKKAAFKKDYDKKAAPIKLSDAWIQLEQGQLTGARNIAEQVIATQPDNAEAYHLLGRIYMAEEKYEPAGQAFRKSLELNENLSESVYGLGVLAQASDNNEAALDYFNKSVEKTPDNTDYILAVFNTLDVMGRFEEAESYINTKLSTKSDDTQLLSAAASLACRMGKTDKAVELYCKALTIEPNNRNYSNSLATLFISSGQWNRAAEVYEKLSNSDNKSQQQESLKWLGMCYMNSGSYQQALDAFDKLSVYSRKDADVWLGMAQAALGISDQKRARICAQKALSLKGEWAEARAVLGCADYLDGKYLTALESFNSLAGDEKFGGLGNFMAGRCYQKLGRTQQAQTAFEKARQDNPQSPLVAMFLNNTKL